MGQRTRYCRIRHAMSFLITSLCNIHVIAGVKGSNGSNVSASGSDAVSGPYFYSCDSNETCFRCMKSGVVIAGDAVCDCKFDCDDFTDEAFCTGAYFLCDAVEGRGYSANWNDYGTLQRKGFGDRKDQKICQVVNSSAYESNASCGLKRQSPVTGNVTYHGALVQILQRYYDVQKRACSVRHCEDLRTRHICFGNCNGTFHLYGFLETYNGLIIVGIIIGVAAIVGNLAVFVVTVIKTLPVRSRLSAEQKLTKMFFLSLSISDLLMGISTLAISTIFEIARKSKPGEMQGIGWQYKCNAIGSMNVIGSEQSVLTMVLITLSRVLGIVRPFSPIPVKAFVVALLITWIATIFIAVIPLSEYFEDYFVIVIRQDEVPLLNMVAYPHVVNITERLMEAYPTRDYGPKPEGKWAGLLYLMRMQFNITQTYRLGYYHNLELCVPNIIPSWASGTKYFSFSIFVFNLFCFALMAAGYVIIYRNRMHTTAPTGPSQRRESQRLKTKIFCILATDFLCWVPLCLVGIINVLYESGRADTSILKNTVLITMVSLLLVLPVNSAVNPFIYSAAPDYLHKQFMKCYKRQTVQSTDDINSSLGGDKDPTTILSHALELQVYKDRQ